MKQAVLNRYEQSDEGVFIVDIAARRAEELYNNFDKSAPYIRRDLDQELVDYIFDAAKELKNESFRICFSLSEVPDKEKESRIRNSINAYFLYLAVLEQQQVYQIFRKSLILFIVGLVILFLSITAHENTLSKDSDILEVFAQGLTVAAWVSLWNAFAIVLIEWFPLARNIRLYRKLAKAPVQFR